MTRLTRPGCMLAALCFQFACPIAPIAQAQVVSQDLVSQEHVHGGDVGSVNLSGAARSGNTSLARDALDRLAALRDQAAASNAYWGTQVEIQRLAALAWLTYEEGQRDQAR